MYQTVIPIAVKAAETSAAGQSIYRYDKNGTAAKAYEAFTREVIRDGEKQYGVLVPALVREKPEGAYEMKAGHRRKMASELAEKKRYPALSVT